MTSHNEAALDWYCRKLQELPPSGGNGCHVGLLAVANAAKKANISEAQAFADLRRRITGSRPVPDSEIGAAVRKAYHSDFKPQHRVPVYVDAKKTRYRFIEEGRNVAGTANTKELEQWLVEKSPDEIPADPNQHAAAFLWSSYEPNDLIFVGQSHHSTAASIKPARDWAAQLEKRGNPFPHFVINPLSGEKHDTTTGKKSYRCDAAVVKWRYTLAEFDDMTRDEQLAFWIGFPAPIAALIDSAGKSIHALIRVDCQTVGEYEEQVESALFRRNLIPLGVDPACRNESRLSRMPGHVRAERKTPQRLIYLNSKPQLKGIGYE